MISTAYRVNRNRRLGADTSAHLTRSMSSAARDTFRSGINKLNSEEEVNARIRIQLAKERRSERKGQPFHWTTSLANTVPLAR